MVSVCCIECEQNFKTRSNFQTLTRKDTTVSLATTNFQQKTYVWVFENILFSNETQNPLRKISKRLEIFNKIETLRLSAEEKKNISTIWIQILISDSW